MSSAAAKAPQNLPVPQFISQDELLRLRQEFDERQALYESQNTEMEKTPVKSAEEWLREVAKVYVKLGGAMSLAEWALANKTIFYTKLFPKLFPAQQQHQVNVTGKLIVEAALPRSPLDEPIDGEFSVAESRPAA